MPSPQQSTNKQILLSRYEQCSPLEQQIIDVMAVIYSLTNRSNIVSCLRKLKIKTETEMTFNEGNLATYVKKLKGTQLMVSKPGKGSRCNPLIAEDIVVALWEKGEFAAIADTVIKVFNLKLDEKNQKVFFQNFDDLLRAARIALYQNDGELLNRYINAYNNPKQFSFNHLEPTSLREVIGILEWHWETPDLLKEIAPSVAELVLIETVTWSVANLEDVSQELEELEALVRLDDDALDFSKLALVEQYLLRGRVQDAKVLLTHTLNPFDMQVMLQGWLCFVTGTVDESIDYYNESLKLLKKRLGRRKDVFFAGAPSVFFVLALLQQSSAQSLRQAAQISELMQGRFHWLQLAYWGLLHLARVQQAELTSRQAIATIEIDIGDYPLQNLLLAFCLIHGDRQGLQQKRDQLTTVLKDVEKRASKNGYDWVASIAMDLLVDLNKDFVPDIAAIYRRKAEKLRGNQWQSWQNLLQTKETWELSLTALANLGGKTENAQQVAEKRLIWLLDISPGWFDLEVREQKRKANGQWSKGRAIAIRRLDEELDSFDYFTEQDRRICRHLSSYRMYNGYGSDIRYEWDRSAILDLVEHPHVYFLDNPKVRVEIKKGEVQLRITEVSDQQLALSLDPAFDLNLEDSEILVYRETPTRLRIYEITLEHRKIASILGDKNQLTVPVSAKEQVLEAINGVANLLTIQSDIGGGNIDAREVDAQSTPHVHLLPLNEGLKAAILVCPFGEEGPYYHPGKGGELVVAEIAGERLQTQRDFEKEAGLAFDILQECPILLDATREAGEFLIEDPETCLELLAQLHQMGDRLVVQWPQGEKFRITHYASPGSFQARIRQQKDWFAMEGELKLGEDMVLDMQHLLQLLEKTPGRFIQLDEGKFLALTEEFRRRLDDLRAFSDRNGKTTRIHPLAAFALEDFTDEIQLDGDRHWQKHIKKIRSLGDVKAEVPSTLQAELRDYQVEGFQWLMRLAHWGMGACLADDMGLGKTLQGLTAILARAPQGASLVIAPTSVCMNWLSEAETFAPTLKPIAFGGGDRQATLDNVQPFDLVVCSYGLLQQDDVAAMLAEVKWQTIVLDEAQAIKNGATKRSKAAMKLQGDFKIITTGTPIENHLGELWNLFRFINPGLLGSQQSFNERFANAIEANHDKATKQRLQRLLRPFILRRTKTQVLTELPSRTEITLSVDLSRDEMAMYEALRREAVNKLTESDAEAGAKHLQVLAEIMRLRRICCNPRLVMLDTPLTGSKLALFGETLEELLSNNHKALVFSQFVDHLTILREYLDEKQIHYQYLDGSTPQKKRKQAVDAFQAGEGDVFLISLKAGGTGLNLTAADYVIHMDPWWNPAVEDQASDRAHRMGQQRPVTIYRLVAKNTIEEKIVALHKYKRDLADSLLEGTDAGGKMSTDELIGLLRDV